VYLETATLMLRIAEQQLRSWQQREQWWRGRPRCRYYTRLIEIERLQPTTTRNRLSWLSLS
jgi:hypothetical protein